MRERDGKGVYEIEKERVRQRGRERERGTVGSWSKKVRRND
jgi:hypothetical protein